MAKLILINKKRKKNAWADRMAGTRHAANP